MISFGASGALSSVFVRRLGLVDSIAYLGLA